MSAPRFLLGAALVWALAAGCAGLEPAPPASLPAASEVLARLRQRPLLASLRTLAQFELHFGAEGPAGLLGEELGRGGAYAGKAVLLWRAPSSLRLEPLSPLGAPVFVVVARGSGLRAYVPGRGRFAEGGADAQSMTRLFGVPIGSGLFVRLLQGGLPITDGVEPGQVSLAWDAEAGALRMELPPGPGFERRQVVWLEPESLLPRAARVGEPGAETGVRFGPFRAWGGPRVPEWVEVTAPRGGTRMRLEIASPPSPASVAFPDSVFDLPVPPGVRVVPLDGEVFR
ncbi:MAG: hypothetical protein AABZ64_11800 [Nitrospinota bacterium]